MVYQLYTQLLYIWLEDSCTHMEDNHVQDQDSVVLVRPVQEDCPQYCPEVVTITQQTCDLNTIVTTAPIIISDATEG